MRMIDANNFMDCCLGIYTRLSHHFLGKILFNSKIKNNKKKFNLYEKLKNKFYGKIKRNYLHDEEKIYLPKIKKDKEIFTNKK